MMRIKLIFEIEIVITIIAFFVIGFVPLIFGKADRTQMTQIKQILKIIIVIIMVTLLIISLFELALIIREWVIKKPEIIHD